MKQDQFIDETLQRTKLRRTPVRAGVLAALLQASAPVGAVEIMSKLPPHTDAVTVYRTLNTLVRKSVIHRIRGEDRIWRYAVGNPQQSHAHQHPHFVCDGCGRVECLTSANIPDTFIQLLGVNRRYAISYAEVVLHGSCPKCKSR